MVSLDDRVSARCNEQSRVAQRNAEGSLTPPEFVSTKDGSPLFCERQLGDVKAATAKRKATRAARVPEQCGT
jgi:hypothetical protein